MLMTTFPQVAEAMADLLSRKRQRAESCSDDEREEDASDAPLCQVCHRHPRKYCCPRCATLTCSLACCTAHKKARGCDGKRDVAAYASATAAVEATGTTRSHAFRGRGAQGRRELGRVPVVPPRA